MTDPVMPAQEKPEIEIVGAEPGAQESAPESIDVDPSLEIDIDDVPF